MGWKEVIDGLFQMHVSSTKYARIVSLEVLNKWLMDAELPSREQHKTSLIIKA